MSRYFLRYNHSNTGLTPTFTLFKKTSDLSDQAPPTIVEIANGAYYFDYAPTFDVIFEADGGATIADESVRYIFDTLSPKDTYINEPLSQIKADVWDETMASHLTAGTTGAKLNAGGGGGGGDPTTIANAVWDVALASHLSAGTTGAKLNAGATSAPYVQFTANGDTIRPIILQVASPKHTQIRVTFSEPVVMTNGSNGALNLANYSVPGLTLIAVASVTSQQVLLTTSAQAPDFLYSLTISNVEDLDGNVIT